MTPADKMVLANGQGEGSGFHFIKPGIIVSNAHVVAQLISGQGAMTAHAETGEQWNLKLLALSPAQGTSAFHPIVLRKSPAPRPIAKNGQYLESEGPDF